MNPSSDFVCRIQAVVGEEVIALHEPNIGQREQEVVSACLASGFVSSVGAFVGTFEESLARLAGVRYVNAVSSGTAALHVALLAVGVKPGDEVLVPSATFIATANAVSYCGAIPHFVDIDPRTMGIDPHFLDNWLESIAARTSAGTVNRHSGNRIVACVPMHTFGHPVDMEGICSVAQKWDLRIVEDAAEALGSMLNGRYCGTFGDVGVLSFNGNKIVTTGGGGAILTNDDEIAKQSRHLSTTAKIPHSWDFDHDDIGFNYRMPNVNAALGCAQLEQLEEMIASKRRLLKAYLEAFESFKSGRIFVEPLGARSNYWLQTLILFEEHEHTRDDLLGVAHAAGIKLRPLWKPIHSLLPYRNAPSSPLPETERLARRVINLPSSSFLV